MPTNRDLADALERRLNGAKKVIVGERLVKECIRNLRASPETEEPIRGYSGGLLKTEEEEV